MKKITDRMTRGGAVPGDSDTLLSVANNIEGKTICAFGEACSWPTKSFLLKFKEEFEAKEKPENVGKPTTPEGKLASANLS